MCAACDKVASRLHPTSLLLCMSCDGPHSSSTLSLSLCLIEKRRVLGRLVVEDGAGLEASHPCREHPALSPAVTGRAAGSSRAGRSLVCSQMLVCSLVGYQMCTTWLCSVWMTTFYNCLFMSQLSCEESDLLLILNRTGH